MKRISLQVLFLTLLLHFNVNAQNDLSQDIGWPRKVSGEHAVIIYYQPQIDQWENYKKLSGRFAFSMTPSGGQEVVGVASFVCDTKTDKEARTTYMHHMNYKDVRFQSLDDKQAASMKKTFISMMPEESESFSTDRILADLSPSSIKANPVQLNNDPPVIFYSAAPAILLIVEGDPVYSPVEKTNIQFVVNTNWDLFYEKSSKQYFLLENDVWLTAKDLNGPWNQTQTLPKEMSSLPTGQNFDDVKKEIPPRLSTNVPKVFYSNKPAELILTEGSPVLEKIAGTQLLYVDNSENDIFVDQAESKYYVLLSGRWFRASSFNGPWSYAGNNLPEDFSKIPENSPKGHVLASVPGTVQASDAVMLAQIPTTVVVNRSEAEANAHVTYDGNPQFAPIDGTAMNYATNTQDKVIKVGDLYYLCFQAVWFVSTSPQGPWKTADSIPAEIYEIPPSSPVYNVTYVTQTNPTSTTVECSTTAGYFGAFIVGATIGAIVSTAIVYGTGWYYPPYIYWGPGAFYPVYRPWPCTYGRAAVYNPWTGGFAVGRRAYGPYASAGTAAWYNPATGRYGRSASVQGWYGGRTAANTYNPWTGTYGHTSQAHNPYAQWGHSAVSNGSQWARSGHVTTAHGTAFGYQTSGGKEGVVTHGANGTRVHTDNGVYAGHDGNVYRKNSNGTWNQTNTLGAGNSGTRQTANTHPTTTRQTTTHKQTTATHTPSPQVTRELDRSAQTRNRGQVQSQQFQHYQRTGEGPGLGGRKRTR